MKHNLHDEIHSTGSRGAIVSFILLFIIIGITVWISFKSDDASKWVLHTHDVKNTLSRVLSTLQDAETGQRGFLLTGDNNYLKPFTNASLRHKTVIKHLRSLTADNPAQQKRLDKMVPLIDEKMAELNETIFLMQTQGQAAALKLVQTDRGKAVMDKLRLLINEMVQEENELLRERSELLQRNELMALGIQLAGFVVIIIIAIFILLRIRSLLALRAEAEEQLRHMANHDPLTGLATRHLGMEFITLAIANAQRNNNKAAVLFIDLDGFKTVNDTLGHDAGDIVLVGVTERLLHCVREADTVMRLGGDEFVVVMSDINNRDNVTQIAEKMIDALAQPFVIATESASIGASIGIALYPDHAQDPQALITNADHAMYDIKNRGKNHFAFASEKQPGELLPT